MMTIKESKQEVGAKNPDKISRPNHGPYKEKGYVDQNTLYSQSEETVEITEVVENQKQKPSPERTGDHMRKSVLGRNMKYEMIVEEDADDGCRGKPDYSKRRLPCRSVIINMEDERIKKQKNQNQNQNQMQKQNQMEKKKRKDESESFLKRVEEACRVRMECASDLRPHDQSPIIDER